MDAMNIKNWKATSLVFVVTSVCLSGLAWLAPPERPEYSLRLETNVPAKMRDGTVLRADILRPDGEGRFPAILYRTPYGKEPVWRESDFPIRAARAGYVMVIQDVRGRYHSDGIFDPYRQELTDGYDSVEWVAELPYCDGNVGMAGLSYPGAVQWLAAVETPPHLKAIVPAMCFSDSRHFFFTGGAFDMSWISWIYRSIAPDLRRKADLEGPKTWQEARVPWEKNKEAWLRHLPLRELPALRDVAPFYYEWLAHPDDDPYWDFADIEAKYDRIRVPALNLSGWHDEGYGPIGAVRNFNGTKHLGSRLIIGPWTHGAPSLASTREGELDFGPNAGLDYSSLLLRWYDRWLKGIDNGADRETPVKLFVMGDNKWREEKEWPLARTRFTSYYLRSGGRLSTSTPSGEETPDRYTYDPLDPVVDPRGGTLGPFDQSIFESRPDVLVYSTDPLEQDVEVTGPIEAEIWAASSATDTDFFVRLLDVHPDGKAYNLQSPTREVLRARYLKDETRPELLTPGKVERFNFRLMMTSNVFKAGHRIRVHITSSFFPHLDRNPNTGHPFGVDAETQKAEQIIHHDDQYPSRIILPVIPR
jgi:putative CocE/NonD family hydrolase